MTVRASRLSRRYSFFAVLAVALLFGVMPARSAETVPGQINSIDQVFNNEQVKARGLQFSLTRDDGVQVPSVANPVVFSQTPNQYSWPSPRLGENTRDILAKYLNLTTQEIDALKTSGVITD